MAVRGAIDADEDDEHTLKNIELRLEEAKAAYAAGPSRLSRVVVLSPSHDGKHFRPGLTREQTCQLTRNGPSLFFRDYSIGEMRTAFWTWFLFFFDIPVPFDQYAEGDPHMDGENFTAEFATWQRFKTETQFRIAFSNLGEVGAVDGHPTSYICFDIGLDAGVIHAYPISETEAVRIMPPNAIRHVRALDG